VPKMCSKRNFTRTIFSLFKKFPKEKSKARNVCREKECREEISSKIKRECL